MELVGIKELVRKLAVEKSYIYNLTRTNGIPHYKIGKYVRFNPPEVEKWLQAKKRCCNETRG